MIKISPTKITFSSKFFNLDLPNDENLKMVIIDTRKVVGLNSSYFISLFFDSKNKVFSPWYGNIVYNILWFLYGAIYPTGSHKTPTTVNGQEQIKNTIDELRTNGYDVVDIENEFQKILAERPDKKLQAGTIEWKKDKIWGFTAILLVFISLIGLVYYKGNVDGSDGFIAIPIFVTITIILIGLVTIFTKTKHFLWKLLFLIIVLAIIGSVIDIL